MCDNVPTYTGPEKGCLFDGSFCMQTCGAVEVGITKVSLRGSGSGARVCSTLRYRLSYLDVFPYGFRSGWRACNQGISNNRPRSQIFNIPPELQGAHPTYTPYTTLLQIFYKIFKDRCIKSDGSRALFVDVGANFGWFSMFAASMGCR